MFENLDLICHKKFNELYKTITSLVKERDRIQEDIEELQKDLQEKQNAIKLCHQELLNWEKEILVATTDS